MKIGRRLCTRGVFEDLLLQRYIGFSAELSSFLHVLCNPIFSSHPVHFSPVVFPKWVLGRSSNKDFRLGPSETKNRHKELNEDGFIQNELRGTSPMEYNSCLDWIKQIDKKSQAYYYLEQDRRTIIHIVKNRFPNCCKRTIQYLIKYFVSNTTALTTLHQENEKCLQQMNLYFDKTVKVRGVNQERGNNKRSTTNAYTYPSLKSAS